jgi:hypothetical protein
MRAAPAQQLISGLSRFLQPVPGSRLTGPCLVPGLAHDRHYERQVLALISAAADPVSQCGPAL